MRIQVGVVSYNGQKDIERCLETVRSQSLAPAGVAVVDNASGDDTRARVAAAMEGFRADGIDFWTADNSTNLGFATAANQILEKATKNTGGLGLAVLLNQDAGLESDCLQQLAWAFEKYPDLAVAGPKIRYPDSGVLQFAGGILDMPRGTGRHVGHHEEDRGQYDEDAEVDFITGAVMALRLSVVAEIGSFNEVFAPGYYEDVELCERVRDASYSIRYIHQARAWHHESSSFSDRWDRLRFAHRNRLIYLLPRLVDVAFAAAFWDAEAEAIESRLDADELRGIAAGALEVLAQLRLVCAGRGVHDAAAVRRIAATLRDVRHSATAKLMSRDT